VLTREQLKAVRKIQIRTSHLVSDLFAGQYHSAFKGVGMEFAEVRPYLPGDDVRTIDWNVTARTGTPHVKRFVEERELTVMLLVDASASTLFGSVKQFKRELVAEIGALLAFSAIRNNDKVGLIIFTDRIELALSPRKGNRHVLRVIREIMNHEAVGRGTDMAAALDYLDRVTHRRCVTFLLSDFLCEGVERSLAASARRHDLVAAIFDDPRDVEIPNLGMIAVEDPETGATLVVDTGDRHVRGEHRRRQLEAHAVRDRMLRSAGIDAVRLSTDEPYAEALLRFFRQRGRRR
jgi:uncharacterized protein (DUF58 family)